MGYSNSGFHFGLKSLKGKKFTSQRRKPTLMNTPHQPHQPLPTDSSSVVSCEKIFVRLSTSKTANAGRRQAVCRLPFRLRCSSV